MFLTFGVTSLGCLSVCRSACVRSRVNRAWKLLNREGFAREFQSLNERLTAASTDLQLHLATEAHIGTQMPAVPPPPSEAAQKAAAAEDLQHMQGQLESMAQQIADLEEAEAERANEMFGKLESADEAAKRRHESVRSHLARLEAAFAKMADRSATKKSDGTKTATGTRPNAKDTAEDGELTELEIPSDDIQLKEKIGSGGFGDVYR
jgi:hypothetical protein